MSSDQVETEGKVTEGKVTDSKVTDSKATDSKATEGKVTEGKVTDSKVTGQGPAGDEPAAAAVRRPSPRPRDLPASPTSRARRAAAAGVQPAARRPSPSPRPPADTAAPADIAAPAALPAALTTELMTEPASDRSDLDAPLAAPAGVAVPHRVRARTPLWLVVALGLVIVLLAGLSGWLVANPAKSGSVSQRDQALAAAKSSVAQILSYNYKTFDADLAKAKAQLTGRANSDYVKAMTDTIKPAAVKAQAVVQAQTDSAGVESVSADGSQVTVVVFGEQKVTNTALSAPRIDPFRVRATMDRVDGHWLVAKFDQI